MNALKQQIIVEILRREGGGKFTDNPKDSGGPTRWGITEKVARTFGYQGDMRELPQSTAEKIYNELFLHAVRFDSLCDYSELVAQEVADTAVNCGVHIAAEFLQRSLNVLNNEAAYYDDVQVDGLIGTQTLAALYAYFNKRGKRGERVLLSMLNALQGARYVRLAEVREKDESFIFGWFANRVDGAA